jgi:hypothetical protein
MSPHKSADPTIQTCGPFYSKKDRDLQGLLPVDSAIYANVPCLNMEQEQIPLPPVVNVSVISSAWIKAHAYD